MKSSIDRIIQERQNAIENALNYTEIQKRMASVSYDRKKLMEGKTLNEKVRLLHASKVDKYGSQYKSTDTLKAEISQSKAMYKKHLTMARMAYEGDRGMQAKLQISGRREVSTEGWIAQAMALYSKTEEIAEAMSQYGVTLEELSQTKAMIEAITTRRQQQLQKIGEAQDATEKRDAALKAMDEWMKDFKIAARLALKDNPQWLEILGIRVKSKVN